MYIPCICVVILSWVSFWVDETDGSDRVGLGIATVLTISFMQGALNDNVPRVSYLKSVDYFLLGSFVFVFMTLIEYVLVLKQSRKERKRKKEREKKTLERERKREAVLMMADSDDEKVNWWHNFAAQCTWGTNFKLSARLELVGSWQRKLPSNQRQNGDLTQVKTVTAAMTSLQIHIICDMKELLQIIWNTKGMRANV